MKIPKDIENWLRSSYLDGHTDGKLGSNANDPEDEIKALEKTILTHPHKADEARARIVLLQQKLKAYTRGYRDGSKRRIPLKGGLG